jgi:hypothetical protein
MAFDRPETSAVEELEKILPGLADPRGRNLAGGAGGGHDALLSAKDGIIVPQRTPLAKRRDPSIM